MGGWAWTWWRELASPEIHKAGQFSTTYISLDGDFLLSFILSLHPNPGTCGGLAKDKDLAANISFFNWKTKQSERVSLEDTSCLLPASCSSPTDLASVHCSHKAPLESDQGVLTLSSPSGPTLLGNEGPSSDQDLGFWRSGTSTRNWPFASEAPGFVCLCSMSNWLTLPFRNGCCLVWFNALLTPHLWVRCSGQSSGILSASLLVAARHRAPDPVRLVTWNDDVWISAAPWTSCAHSHEPLCQLTAVGKSGHKAGGGGDSFLQPLPYLCSGIRVPPDAPNPSPRSVLTPVLIGQPWNSVSFTSIPFPGLLEQFL